MLEEVSKKKVNSNLLISSYCFEITGVEKKKLFLYFFVFFGFLFVFSFFNYSLTSSMISLS
jgi:hypothetical protein